MDEDTPFEDRANGLADKLTDLIDIPNGFFPEGTVLGGRTVARLAEAEELMRGMGYGAISTGKVRLADLLHDIAEDVERFPQALQRVVDVLSLAVGEGLTLEGKELGDRGRGGPKWSSGISRD